MKSELMSTQRSVQAMNQKQMEIEGKINMFANIGKKYLGKFGPFFRWLQDFLQNEKIFGWLVLDFWLQNF